MDEELKIKFPEVKRGDSGDFVLLLQKILYSRGITGRFSKPVDVNGDFDISTRFAVQNFQASRSGYIKYSGVCDALTWRCLLTVGEVKFGELMVNFPDIRYGEYNPYILLIQEILFADGYYKGELNYIFDNSTIHALKDFAVDHNVVFNGVVDQVVWLELVYHSALPNSLKSL